MMAVLPHIINGLTLGLLFALIALGFTLIVGVMEVINLAHGSLFALGAYFALTLMGGDWFAGTSFGLWWLELPLEARFVFAIIVGPILAGLAVWLSAETCK